MDWLDTNITARIPFNYGAQNQTWKELCGRRTPLFCFCAGTCGPSEYVKSYRVKYLEGVRRLIHSKSRDITSCPRCKGPVFWSRNYRETGYLQERALEHLISHESAVLGYDEYSEQLRKNKLEVEQRLIAAKEQLERETQERNECRKMRGLPPFDQRAEDERIQEAVMERAKIAAEKLERALKIKMKASRKRRKKYKIKKILERAAKK
jgi:hypothetical protein